MNDYRQSPSSNLLNKAAKNLLNNLRISWLGFFACLRLRPAKLNHLKVDLVDSISIAICLIVLVSGIDWYMLKQSGMGVLRFNPRSLESEAVQFGAFLLCSALASRFAHPAKVSAQLVFIALTGAKLLSILIEISISTLPKMWLQTIGQSNIHWVLLLWVYLFGFITLRRGLQLTAKHVALAMLPLVALQAFQERVVPVDFWREVKVAKSTTNPASEDVLEKQNKLLPMQLAGLEPQRQGKHDVYFLGFAPFATEDVFKLELDAIMPMMERRFDAKGRALRLTNHLNTLDKYPFASLSNLRRSLASIAEKMDVEEDVFVLYLTSHGSKQFQIASHIPPMAFNEVTPTNLKAMLDEAGIKNRVLIVSACYAGGFIEPLKDSNTLVMTAAAANRPSFGCGAESSFTYFGKAVMDEQLGKKTRSFEKAFSNALPIIREREEAQGFDSSDPQIFIGEKIRPILTALEKQLSEQ
jgi:Peptidase C13 family